MSIFSLKVQEPSGDLWKIRRRWFPRRALPDAKKRFFWWRGRFGRVVLEGLDPIIDDFLAFLAAVLILAVMIFFVFPILLLVFDLLILVFLMLLGILSRVVFKRPWIIEATSSDGRTVERDVIGWVASNYEIEFLRNQIVSGTIGKSDSEQPPLWPRDGK